MLSSLKNDKIPHEEKDFILSQKSNILCYSKFSESTIEEMSLSLSLMVSKLLEVSAFFEIRRSYISMDLQIENILISEDITISNMGCLNGREIMVLNFVISWEELQQDFLSILWLEWVNLRSRSGEWSQNFMALMIWCLIRCFIISSKPLRESDQNLKNKATICSFF